MAQGYRGLLAPWIGGAGSPPGVPPASAGYRSMLAFWMGGAANPGGTPPAPARNLGAAPNRRKRIQDDDEEILAITLALLQRLT